MTSVNVLKIFYAFSVMSDIFNDDILQYEYKKKRLPRKLKKKSNVRINKNKLYLDYIEKERADKLLKITKHKTILKWKTKEQTLILNTLSVSQR